MKRLYPTATVLWGLAVYLWLTTPSMPLSSFDGFMTWAVIHPATGWLFSVLIIFGFLAALIRTVNLDNEPIQLCLVRKLFGQECPAAK